VTPAIADPNRPAIRVDIASNEDVVFVRQRAREQSHRAGFSLLETTKLVTAASELARNTLEHGGGGHAELEVITDEQVNRLLLAITGTIGRLLEVTDDKCPDGPLKPMLLFRIVEDLAREGYDLDSVLDFVRRAHAGALEPQETLLPEKLDVFKPAMTKGPAGKRPAWPRITARTCERGVNASARNGSLG